MVDRPMFATETDRETVGREQWNPRHKSIIVCMFHCDAKTDPRGDTDSRASDLGVQKGIGTEFFFVFICPYNQTPGWYGVPASMLMFQSAIEETA
jgi:hypothetical protein